MLWSHAAHQPERHFVREEAETARQLGRYFPICLDDSGVPFGFAEFQWFDLVDWQPGHTDARLDALLDELAAQLDTLAASALSDPAPRVIDARHHPLSNGMPPSWASAWGQDEYGAWVDIQVDAVVQRLRWIPPGQFQMGSPDYEPGRFIDEGPQHAVTLSRGFWLFDTPCTQVLWQAVMGENPSRFQSAERPVEQVSWQDCQAFLGELNSSIPGLHLDLPSEAQWEYACRGGAPTPSPIYSGDLRIVGDGNAPALDAIAWYGGNSGEGFELADGEEIAYLNDRQFDSNPSGSHVVKGKKPNAWGLYDMLGNVWEWCLDGQRPYRAEAEIDPLGTQAAGADRVVRGGSWISEARYCRAACRYVYHPGGRANLLGFRPARVQV